VRVAEIDRQTDRRTDSDGATRRCPRARCSRSSRLDGRTRWRAVMRRIASRDQTCSSSSSRGSKQCCTHSVVSIIHPRQRQHYPHTHTHTHTHSIVSCYRRVIDAPRTVREARSLCNGRASIRLSVCLPHRCQQQRRPAGLLLSAGVCTRYRSVAARAPCCRHHAGSVVSRTDGGGSAQTCFTRPERSRLMSAFDC